MGYQSIISDEYKAVFWSQWWLKISNDTADGKSNTELNHFL